jgi:hypothetical protein
MSPRADADLLELLPALSRGPRREGVFALWLIVRVALDLLLDPPLAERAVRRRIAALELRLSSLTLPAPLRRALNAALPQLATAAGTPAEVPQILSQLVAPAREAAGPEAGEAVNRAALAARQRLRERR